MKTMRLYSFGSTGRSQSRAATTSDRPKEDEVLQSAPSPSSSSSSSSSGSEIEIVSWKSDGGSGEEVLGMRSKEAQPLSVPLPSTTSAPVPGPNVVEARQEEEEKNTNETVSVNEEEATEREGDERPSPPSDLSTEESGTSMEGNNEPSESEDKVNIMDVGGDDENDQDDDDDDDEGDIVLELPAMLRRTLQSNKSQDYLSANFSIMTESTEPTSNLASRASLRDQEGLLMPSISSESELSLTKSQSNLSLESKKSTSSRRSTKSTKSTRSIKKSLTITRDGSGGSGSGQEEAEKTTMKIQRENLLLAKPYSFQSSTSIKSAFSKKSVRTTRSTKSARSTRSSMSEHSPLFNGVDPASFDISATQSNVSSVGNDDFHSQSSNSSNRSEDDDDDNIDGDDNEEGESLTITSTRSFGSTTIGSATYATMASKYTSATLGDQTLGWLAREEEKMKSSWLGRMFGFDPLQAEGDDEVSVVSDVELDDHELVFDGNTLIRTITGQKQNPTPTKTGDVPMSKFMPSDSRFDDHLYDTKEVDRRRGGVKAHKKSVPAVARKIDPFFVKNLPAKVEVAAVDAANTAFGGGIPDELPIPRTDCSSSLNEEKSALSELTEATDSVTLSSKTDVTKEISYSIDNVTPQEANGTSAPNQESKEASLFWSTSLDDLIVNLTKVGKSFEAKDAEELQECKGAPTVEDAKTDKKISWDSNVKAGKADLPTASLKAGKRTFPKKPISDPRVSVNVYTSTRRGGYGGGKTKKKRAGRSDGSGGGGLLGFFTGFKTIKQKTKKVKTPLSGATNSTWAPSRKAMPWPSHK